MYAVVRTGGKQLRVEPGDVVSVERLPGAVGDTIELSDVLMVGGEGDVRVGTPRVDGARVVAEIEGELKGPKIKIFKLKRRKRYRRRLGHRQNYTRLRIQSIEV